MHADLRLITLVLALLSLAGCSSLFGDKIREGDEARECRDGADNDADGDFDCRDDDCEGSPDCVDESDADDDTYETNTDSGETGENTDDTDEGDTDTDTDADSDSDSDIDSDVDSDVDTDLSPTTTDITSFEAWFSIVWIFPYGDYGNCVEEFHGSGNQDYTEPDHIRFFGEWTRTSSTCSDLGAFYIWYDPYTEEGYTLFDVNPYMTQMDAWYISPDPVSEWSDAPMYLANMAAPIDPGTLTVHYTSVVVGDIMTANMVLDVALYD